MPDDCEDNLCRFAWKALSVSISKCDSFSVKRLFRPLFRGGDRRSYRTYENVRSSLGDA